MVEISIEGQNGKKRTFVVKEPQPRDRVVNISRGGAFQVQAVETTPLTIKERLYEALHIRERNETSEPSETDK